MTSRQSRDSNPTVNDWRSLFSRYRSRGCCCWRYSFRWEGLRWEASFLEQRHQSSHNTRRESQGTREDSERATEGTKPCFRATTSHPWKQRETMGVASGRHPLQLGIPPRLGPRSAPGLAASFQRSEEAEAPRQSCRHSRAPVWDASSRTHPEVVRVADGPLLPSAGYRDDPRS